MFIEIDSTARYIEPRLRDADNFQSLKVVLKTEKTKCTSLPDAALRLGTWVDNTHLYINTEGLLALAGDYAEDQVWRSQFDTMISRAIESGWTDEFGAVRLHLECVSQENS